MNLKKIIFEYRKIKLIEKLEYFYDCEIKLYDNMPFNDNNLLIIYKCSQKEVYFIKNTKSIRELEKIIINKIMEDES